MNEVQVGQVYNHYKFGAVIVESIAYSNDVEDKELYVVFRTLNGSGNSLVMPRREFFVPINGEQFKQDTTCVLMNFHENPARNLTTEQLLNELKLREDNPYRDVTIDEDRVIESSFVVGEVKYSDELARDYFVTSCSDFDTCYEAEDWLQRHYNTRLIVAQRLILFEDFI